MTEALRFPWEDEDHRREVAPSAFRPRTARTARSAGARAQATRPLSRRTANRARRPSVARTSAAEALSRSIPHGGVRPAGHASRPAGHITDTVGHASRAGERERGAGRVVHGPQRERHDPDYLLMAAAVALSAIGILMVYSSLGVRSAIRGSVFDAVTTQLGWGLLGGLVLLVVMRLDYRYWRSFSVLGMAIAVVLLLLVIGPSIPPLLEPITANGATRWLQIGSLPRFQPTEVAKLAIVVYLAHWLSSRGTVVRSFRGGLVPFALMVGVVSGLILLEPDLGTTGVLVLTTFAMFFVAGGSVVQLLLLVPVGVAGVAAVVQLKPYMLARVETFLDPFADPAGAGFQTVHGLYALALGGVTGQGLGVSQQPNGLSLPAAENDFIFAVVGQEFGLVGGLVVIALFLLLAWRGVRVAMDAPDTFGALLAFGITGWLTLQAFINIGVVVNLIPLTGMPLPFLSDGGTSLVVVLAAVGILLSISRETVTRGASAHEDAHRGRGHGRPHLSGPGRRHPAPDPST